MSETDSRSNEPGRIGEPWPTNAGVLITEIAQQSEQADVTAFVRSFADKFYGGHMDIAKSRVIQLIQAILSDQTAGP